MIAPFHSLVLSDMVEMLDFAFDDQHGADAANAVRVPHVDRDAGI